jgi:ubiquinone/menaquinone biosynthesis C-methylase UbiE
MIERPKEFFDGTEMPTSGWWEALWPDPAGVLCAVGVESGMEVIDLCSGDGWFTLHIAKIARHVVAIDIDPVLLDVAQTRLAERGASNCTYIAGNAYELAELWKKPVDFVFMANAFHGVPNKERLARCVRDVLKPDGKFAVVNWHQRPREETQVLGEPRGPRTELRIGPIGVKAAVEPSGLTLTEALDIPPYHYGAVFEK